MIKQSETHLGEKLLEKFGGILASELGRDPLLNVDVFFQYDSRDTTENFRFHQEQVGKAVNLGLLPRDSFTQDKDSKNITCNQGPMGFMVFMRTDLDLDSSHFNMNAINEGLAVGTYNDGDNARILKATPVVLDYEIKFFTANLSLNNEWARKWMNWFYKDYAIEFNLEIENAKDGTVSSIAIVNQLEIEPRPNMEAIDRYSNTPYYPIGGRLKLHTLLLEEDPAYIVKSIDVNIYQETGNGSPILLKTVIVD